MLATLTSTFFLKVECKKKMIKMFAKEKLFLIAFIFTTFNSNTNVLVGSVKLLDMTQNVVDDMYKGCREEAMETVIQSGLLRRELDKSAEFQKAWNANTQCSFIIPGGIKEHTAALSVYYQGDKRFIKEFNSQVERMGVNFTTYKNNFHFKSLHFLLMDALMLLKPQMCKTGYAVVDDLQIPKLGSAVRLAGFTIMDTDTTLTDLDDAILLKINSCYFINLEGSICKKNIGQMLLSPSEVFTVEKVERIRSDDADYKEIVLKHSSLNSTHNCYIISRAEAVTSAHMLVPLIMTYSLFSVTL